MESWAMIAKPNSLFYQDIVKNIESSARLGKEESDKKNREAGVRYHNEGHRYFFVANYQYQTVLQRKQKELDAQHGPVKYAVEYYKIWSIESFDAGLTLLNNLDT